MQLLDPSGNVRAILVGPVTAETLLARAWNLGPRDRFTVLGVGENAWALAVYRPDAPIKPAFIGPEGTGDRETLIELAWLALIDEGWSVRHA